VLVSFDPAYEFCFLCAGNAETVAVDMILNSVACEFKFSVGILLSAVINVLFTYVFFTTG
jgi:hypothetical protein